MVGTRRLFHQHHAHHDHSSPWQRQQQQQQQDVWRQLHVEIEMTRLRADVHRNRVSFSTLCARLSRRIETMTAADNTQRV